MSAFVSNTSILFVCALRGGRARIAESFARVLGNGALRTASACFEPGPIRGLPVRAMNEVGLELPGDPVSSVFQRYRSREAFDCVVGPCDESGTELCDLVRPNLETTCARRARLVRRDAGGFSLIEGAEDERLARAGRLRDRTGGLVEDLLIELGAEAPA